MDAAIHPSRNLTNSDLNTITIGDHAHRVEGRLIAMLEGESGLSLDLLNRATQAWVEQEYHRTKHSEINATPLQHYLAGPNVARVCPSSCLLYTSPSPRDS